MESPTTAHHGPLISFCPVLLSPLLHLDLGDTQAQWAWLESIRNKASVSSTFLTQPQELRAMAGLQPEVDPFTDQDFRSIYASPVFTHWKTEVKRKEGSSQNHITTIRVRSSDSLSSVVFLRSFLNPFHPSSQNRAASGSSCLVIYLAPRQPEAKPYLLSGVLSREEALLD